MAVARAEARLRQRQRRQEVEVEMEELPGPGPADTVVKARSEQGEARQGPRPPTLEEEGGGEPLVVGEDRPNQRVLAQASALLHRPWQDAEDDPVGLRPAEEDEELRELFAAAGPNLGDLQAQAEALQAEVPAPVRRPFLPLLQREPPRWARPLQAAGPALEPYAPTPLAQHP